MSGIGETFLADLAVGQSAKVIGIGGKRLQRMKLLDMGLTPDTRLEVKRLAPMGDPIEVALRGYVLSLRRDEAKLVSVEVDTP